MKASGIFKAVTAVVVTGGIALGGAYVTGNIPEIGQDFLTQSADNRNDLVIVTTWPRDFADLGQYSGKDSDDRSAPAIITTWPRDFPGLG